MHFPTPSPSRRRSSPCGIRAGLRTSCPVTSVAPLSRCACVLSTPFFLRSRSPTAEVGSVGSVGPDASPAPVKVYRNWSRSTAPARGKTSRYNRLVRRRSYTMCPATSPRRTWCRCSAGGTAVASPALAHLALRACRINPRHQFWRPRRTLGALVFSGHAAKLYAGCGWPAPAVPIHSLRHPGAFTASLTQRDCRTSAPSSVPWRRPVLLSARRAPRPGCRRHKVTVDAVARVRAIVAPQHSQRCRRRLAVRATDGAGRAHPGRPGRSWLLLGRHAEFGCSRRARFYSAQPAPAARSPARSVRRAAPPAVALMFVAIAARRGVVARLRARRAAVNAQARR